VTNQTNPIASNPGRHSRARDASARRKRRSVKREKNKSGRWMAYRPTLNAKLWWIGRSVIKVTDV
jgi:hypothetical protein